MLKSCTFKIQITCPGCNSFHTVTSITDFDTCQNCGRNISISSVLFERMFGIMDRIQYMNAFTSGNIEQIGGNAYKLEYSSMPAYCENCNAVIDENILKEVMNSDKPYSCATCSHKMPVRSAGTLVKQFHPKAIGVINDSSGTDANEKNTDTDSAIVFSCMTCNGALELTSKTKRLIKCTYCSNENYLPDAIWTRLHPNKDVVPLFVIIDINEDDLKNSLDYFLSVTAISVYSKHFENFLREYFEQPFTTDALISWIKFFVSSEIKDKLGVNMDITKLQKYFFDNFKLGIENHPVRLKETVAEYSNNLTAEIQLMLSEDKSESVRIALTKNKDTEKDIIKKLQKDKSPVVSAEAMKVKTGLFSKLFG